MTFDNIMRANYLLFVYSPKYEEEDGRRGQGGDTNLECHINKF